MKRNIITAAMLLIAAITAATAQAQPRTDTEINEGWTVAPIAETNMKAKRTPVTLPTILLV